MYEPGRRPNKESIEIGGNNNLCFQLTGFLTSKIKDTFIEREDCLISLDVNFGIPDKKFGPTEEEESRNPRKILSITERYSLPEHAEPKKCIAERVYNLEEENIKLKFHREKDRILCQVQI